MPDITMCQSIDCPWRYKCLRYITTPGEHQSWADFYSRECKDGYKMFIPEGDK